MPSARVKLVASEVALASAVRGSAWGLELPHPRRGGRAARLPRPGAGLAKRVGKSGGDGQAERGRAARGSRGRFASRGAGALAIRAAPQCPGEEAAERVGGGRRGQGGQNCRRGLLNPPWRTRHHWPSPHLTWPHVGLAVQDSAPRVSAARARAPWNSATWGSDPLGCAAWGGGSVGLSPSRPRPCGLHPEGLRPVRSRPIGFPVAGVRPVVLRFPKPRSSRFHSWGRARIALRKTAALELGATPRPVRREDHGGGACC